jgi:hypothetical protein
LGIDNRVNERLHSALLAAGEVLKEAAWSIGGTIDFDPAIALSRDAPPHRQCRLIKAADGWIAVNLAREDDRLSVPAWLGCGVVDEDIWEVIVSVAAVRTCASLLEQAVLLGMPVALVSEAVFSICAAPRSYPIEASIQPKPTTARVLDLSALWAGPYCGALLAEAGMKVTKVESLSRPDPMRSDVRLNGAKRHISLTLSDTELTELIAASDILITSARPHALARLGLTEETMFARNPRLIWIAITAYGWFEDNAMRVGFGDDCAAAGGLLRWERGVPSFMGDALADPITGIAAATKAMEWMAQGRCGLLDISLARSAALIAAALTDLDG